MTARHRILQRRAQFIAAAVASVAIGCSDDEQTADAEPQPCLSQYCEPEVGQVTSFEIVATAPLCVGGDVNLEARVRRCDGSSGKVTAVWKSSDPAILSVDATGRASPKATGKATITATAEGRQTTETFDVTACLDGGMSDAVSDVADAD